MNPCWDSGKKRYFYLKIDDQQVYGLCLLQKEEIKIIEATKKEMKIYLAELDRLLFPRMYPYYNEGFREELENLDNNSDYDAKLLCAISFKVKVVKLSLKIKPEIHDLIKYIYDDFIGRIFEWNRPYEWQDLKLVLSFFVLFRDVKTFRELEKRIKKPATIAILRKYKPQLLRTSQDD